MKNLKIFTLICALSVLTFSIDAQVVEKGQFTAGLSFVNYAGGQENTTSPGISFGYCISDNIVIGTEFLGSVSFDGGNSLFTFQPHARYYFSNFYGQLGFIYTSSSNDGSSDSNIDISLSGGYAFNLTERVLIEPSVRLDLLDDTQFGMGLGVQFILE